MQEEAKELIKAGADAAFRPFSEVISNLLGPVSREYGLMWGDAAAARRETRKKKLKAKVDERTHGKTFEARLVDDSIAIPLLEAALRTDEEILQDQWANLMATALNRSERPVSVAFVTILSELTPVEVKFLDAIYGRAVARTPGDANFTLQSGLTLEFSEQELAELFEGARLSKGVIATMSVQEHHALPDYVDDMNNMRFCIDLFKRQGIFTEITPQVRKDFHGEVVAAVPDRMAQRYHFTTLGRLFVHACQRPKS